jgi:ankyrin repeat protein
MKINNMFSRFLISSIPRPATVLLILLAWSIPAFCGEIHEAVKAGNLGKAKALLKQNPELVFSKDNDGRTPLHWAAEKGHKGVMELLLANQADINARNNNGRTPMQLASAKDHKDVVELLLAKGADVNADAEALFETGISYLQAGQYNKSRWTFRTLIQIYPHSEKAPDAVFDIADSYYQEGGIENLLRAEEEYKNFVIFWPDSPKAPEAQLKIIKLNIQMMGLPDGNQEYAIKALKEIERFEKKFPESNYLPIVNQLKILVQAVPTQ